MEQISKIKILVAVFAYNEEKNIGTIIEQLAKQTALASFEFDIQFHILVNGTNDSTVYHANKAISKLNETIQNDFIVHDLELGGKARTWNFFMKSVVSNETRYAFFVDADIKIDNNNLFLHMLNVIEENKNVDIVNSKPVKDISTDSSKLNLVEKVIVASSGKLDSADAICGQLYLGRLSTVGSIRMPVGLPVEDGFLSAMVKTNLLTELDKTSNILTDKETFHVYESLKSISELITHQTRIVIGGSINKLVFDYVVTSGETQSERALFLDNISKDEEWLNKIIETSLPTVYGYIPFSFLTKRIKRFTNSQDKSIKTLFIALLGFGFDSVVFLMANYKMYKGAGAGHW